MKRTISLFLALALVLCACGQKAENATTWQEQYDLGVRYLSEGNYEEAVISFTAAIEIDSKRSEAYIGLSDAYIKLEQYDMAVEVLEDAIANNGDLEELVNALNDLLARITPTERNETDGEWVQTDKVSGTLDLRDVGYAYHPGGDIVEWNEGAIGGMDLNYTVYGPSGVCEVLISTWTDSEFPFELEEINTNISEMVQIWKQEWDANTVPLSLPIERGTGFPVFPEDAGMSMDVLLVGLDKNCDCIGYSIITVQLPETLS